MMATLYEMWVVFWHTVTLLVSLTAIIALFELATDRNNRRRPRR